ncbi:hypothetical protein DL764_002822 [Monosporascus ibericus]|uniref:BZIP domain-containing protein n=1 Tax=Monosporascus ibericus TaxID=155417 RepID=A0A4V1XBP8_9PEZI|nr:hypothetical protein DL764_002822 [Monosporascus ibericus]
MFPDSLLSLNGSMTISQNGLWDLSGPVVEADGTATEGRFSDASQCSDDPLTRSAAKAAAKCRQKAKQSVSELQNRERELLQQNRYLTAHAGSLREEVINLKNEILRHSHCDSDVIQAYINKAAREIR